MSIKENPPSGKGRTTKKGEILKPSLQRKKEILYPSKSIPSPSRSYFSTLRTTLGLFILLNSSTLRIYRTLLPDRKLPLEWRRVLYHKNLVRILSCHGRSGHVPGLVL
jgi:hypothetical protein